MSTLSINKITITREGKPVVSGASLTVGSGEIHIILGPNGSGKTTLLNAIMGHPAYEVTEGTIILDGEDITNLPTEKKAAKGIFLSLQHVPAIPGVTMLSLLHRAHRLVTGIEMSVPDFYRMITEKVKKFGLNEKLLTHAIHGGVSGGEKKQGELIQLLALEPKFALLDEIDSGVDIDSLNKVFAGIAELRTQGTGFIIVTHLATILEKIVPDRVSVMKDGAIVRTGGVELAQEILKNGFENTI